MFVEVAPGFETIDKKGIPFVMQLGKSLYGLAQSPQNWWRTINPRLVEIGSVPLKSDPYVCICDHDDVVIIITLYVDDLLVAGRNIQVIETVKKKLADKFEISDMGDVSLVLGMKVTRDRETKTLSICKENFTKSLLECFGMRDCNTVSTPDVGAELSTEQPEETLLNKE